MIKYLRKHTLFTLMGFPYSLIMFKILMAYKKQTVLGKWITDSIDMGITARGNQRYITPLHDDRLT